MHLNIEHTKAIDAILAKKKEKNGEGRYSFEQMEEVCPGLCYTVHSYLTPRKQTGYVHIFEFEDDGKKYQKAVGYGPEAEARTYDWREVEELI